MHALTVVPGHSHSLQLDTLDMPAAQPQQLLVCALALGICGTDREIVGGTYGWAPPNSTRLVIGHESLGRVEVAPVGSGFERGDLVVGIVRHPDPVPCANCAIGEFDMCRNGEYTEHGIKGRNGFGCEWFTLDVQRAVKIPPSLGLCGVLLEPTSIVAKAWEQVDRITQRSAVPPKNALIVGAGPVGLLAALHSVQRGLETHVVDIVVDGIKPQLVAELGAHYHAVAIETIGIAFDVVIECTGIGKVILAATEALASGGILCSTGLSSGGRSVPLNLTEINRNLVLENEVIFGSVNANRRHYEMAVRTLALANSDWLEKLITRRVPLHQWEDAFVPRATDVKTIIEFSS